MKFMIMPVPNQFKGYAGGQTVIQWPLSTKNAKTAHNLQVHLWWKEQKRTPSNICSEKLCEMLAQTRKSKQLAYIGNNINWTVSEVWALNKDDSHDQTSWSVSDKKQRPLSTCKKPKLHATFKEVTEKYFRLVVNGTKKNTFKQRLGEIVYLPRQEN